jgi:hypothetical protein
MALSSTEILGWVATSVFVASYFFAKPAALRAVQMSGATLWIVYGFLIGAVPVVAANALVFTAAAWTFARKKPQNTAEATAEPAVE